jgi:hypothetical protein
MENPWKNLPKTHPFVLADDFDNLNNYNKKLEGSENKDNYYLHIEEKPVPFVGNVLTAPVVLLLANPGYSDSSKHLLKDVYYLENLEKMILHQKTEYPFFCLDPQIAIGKEYWHSKLRLLIKEFDLKSVANSVCNIQFVPHHSKEFKYNEYLKLPSQEYNFYLIKKAMERNALIVITRLEKLWKESVPELNNYNHLITLKNKRQPSISPENIEGDGFQRIINAIKSFNS